MPSDAEKARASRVRQNITLGVVCLVLAALAAVAALTARDWRGPGEACVPILMYHKVGDRAYSRWWVPVEEFEAQLKALRAYGYRTVPLARLHDYRAGRARLPRRPVILAFDDGYENNYTHAYPLLRKYGFTATISLIPPLVAEDDAGRMSNTWDGAQERKYGADHLIWPEVLEMARGGIEFASHSMTHPPLTRAKDLGRELAASKTALEERLGRPVDVLCYPFGVHDEHVRAAAAAAGYRVAITAHGSVADMATADLLTLERIGIEGGRDSVVFEGEPDHFFMKKVDPAFALPLLAVEEMQVASRDGTRRDRVAPGERLVVTVAVANSGPAQAVTAELEVRAAGSDAGGAALTVRRRMPGEGERAVLEFPWRVPAGAGPHEVRLVVRDRTGTLVFLDTGWMDAPWQAAPAGAAPGAGAGPPGDGTHEDA